MPWIRRHFAVITVLAILVLGAYLRLYQIRDYMTFLGDEGRDVLVVKRMIVDHKFTLLGPTASVGGFFLGPIYYYFMLPFLWLSRLDPVGPAIMVALFGIATIYLVFLTGKRLFGIRAGLLSAGIYAVSPVVIAYSRSSWNPNVVPFFSILLLYLLWKISSVPSRRDAVYIGLILGIGVQLHYLFLFLYVVTALWYLIRLKHRVLWQSALGTIIGWIIGISPFLAFEVRHGFTNINTIIQFLTAGKDTGFEMAKYVTITGDVLFRSFGRLLFRMPLKEVWSNYPDWYIAIIVGITKVVIYITAVIGFITAILGINPIRKKISKTVRNSGIITYLMPDGLYSTGIGLLMVWFVTTIGLFGLYKKPIYDYYLGIMFPLPFLAIGLIFSLLSRLKWGNFVVLIGWVSIMVFNWCGRPFLYAPNKQLDQIERISKVTYDKTGGFPFNFALITDGNSDHGYRYFFEIWNNPPVVIENVQKDPERKTVTDQLLVICETIDCQPLGHPLWEIAGFGRAEIAGVWEVPFVKIYKLVHYNETKEK